MDQPPLPRELKKKILPLPTHTIRLSCHRKPASQISICSCWGVAERHKIFFAIRHAQQNQQGRSTLLLINVAWLLIIQCTQCVICAWKSSACVSIGSDDSAVMDVDLTHISMESETSSCVMPLSSFFCHVQLFIRRLLCLQGSGGPCLPNMVYVYVIDGIHTAADNE